VQIYTESLTETNRFLANNSLSLSDYVPGFERYLGLIRQAHPVDASSRMLEIGTGTGWFPLICKAKGLQCKGLEISPQFVAAAQEMGRQNGIVPDIELGNIEESDLGVEQYDVIIASSVFEHVEFWQSGLKKAYDALKPGGALFFESTNKFCIISGEHRMPFYGWMPDAMRYRFRTMLSGKDVMKFGIDFNQFRYPLLRRTFRELGFRKILDVIDLVNIGRFGFLKRLVLTICRKTPVVKSVVLTFYRATTFVCLK
jgi:2-polyprenyl-3-methyl-5-hydroxy-6-metoxy-1,4-benzoquinol methylase